MIKAIIFDCFGVLYANAQKIFYERHKELFRDPGLLDKLNLKIDLGKMTQPEFFKALEKEIGLPADQIGNEIQGALVANQQLVDLIKKLKSKYKIGLLSNTAEDEIEVLYRDKLDILFDSIIVSYKLGVAKPDPKIFNHLLENINLAPDECLFVDDNEENILAAEKLGFQGFVFKDFSGFENYLSHLKINY